MPLIDHRTVIGNADARLARGFLEIHRLAGVGSKGCIEGLRMRARRGESHRFYLPVCTRKQVSMCLVTFVDDSRARAWKSTKARPSPQQDAISDNIL